MIHVKRNEIYMRLKYNPSKGKFYYSIMYKENGTWFNGFGSYYRENVERWVKEYFVIEN